MSPDVIYMSTAIKRADSPKVREAIFALEDVMRTMPQVDLPVLHHFAPGLYARELFIPQGVTLTGYIHKTEHISILLSGTLIMADGEGGSIEVTGPRIEIAKPGIKRVAFAKTNVRFMTVHATDETDVEVLHTELVTNDITEVIGFDDMIEQPEKLEGGK